MPNPELVRVIIIHSFPLLQFVAEKLDSGILPYPCHCTLCYSVSVSTSLGFILEFCVVFTELVLLIVGLEFAKGPCTYWHYCFFNKNL